MFFSPQSLVEFLAATGAAQNQNFEITSRSEHHSNVAEQQSMELMKSHQLANRDLVPVCPMLGFSSVKKTEVNIPPSSAAMFR